MLEIGSPEQRGTPNEERQKSDSFYANEPTHVPERHGLKKSVKPMKPMSGSDRTKHERPSNIHKPSNQLGSVMISADDFPDPDEPLRDPEMAQYNKQTAVARNQDMEKKDTIIDNPDIDKTEIKNRQKRHTSDLDISRRAMASLTPEEYSALKDQLGLSHTSHG